MSAHVSFGIGVKMSAGYDHSHDDGQHKSEREYSDDERIEGTARRAGAPDRTVHKQTVPLPSRMKQRPFIVVNTKR